MDVRPKHVADNLNKIANNYLNRVGNPLNLTVSTVYRKNGDYCCVSVLPWKRSQQTVISLPTSAMCGRFPHSVIKHKRKQWLVFHTYNTKDLLQKIKRCCLPSGPLNGRNWWRNLQLSRRGQITLSVTTTIAFQPYNAVDLTTSEKCISCCSTHDLSHRIRLRVYSTHL
jgi:hypothetical protein